MKITVRTLTKETYTCDLEPTSSVLELKQELSKLCPIEVEYNRLIYSGNILRDDETINGIGYGYKLSDFMVMMKKRHKDPIVTEKITEQTPTEPIQIPTQPEQTQSEQTQSEPIHEVKPQQEQEDEDEDSQERDEKLLSPIQIMQLMNILTTDPTISQILALHPQLKTELRNPQVLLELLRRMNHPIMKEFTRYTFKEPGQVNRNAIGGKNLIEKDTSEEAEAEEEEEEDEEADEEQLDDLPEVVHITQSEFNELNEIKNQVKEFVGELSITEGQLNGIIYEVYKMLNKDADATLAFVINRIIDEGL